MNRLKAPWCGACAANERSLMWLEGHQKKRENKKFRWAGVEPATFRLQWSITVWRHKPTRRPPDGCWKRHFLWQYERLCMSILCRFSWTRLVAHASRLHPAPLIICPYCILPTPSIGSLDSRSLPFILHRFHPIHLACHNYTVWLTFPHTWGHRIATPKPVLTLGTGRVPILLPTLSQ